MRDCRPVAGVCAAPAQGVRAGRDGRLLGEAGEHLLVQSLLVLGVLPLLHLLLGEAGLLVSELVQIHAVILRTTLVLHEMAAVLRGS